MRKNKFFFFKPSDTDRKPRRKKNRIWTYCKQRSKQDASLVFISRQSSRYLTASGVVLVASCGAGNIIAQPHPLRYSPER